MAYKAGDAELVVVPILKDFHKKVRDAVATLPKKHEIEILPKGLGEFTQRVNTALSTAVVPAFEVPIVPEDISRFAHDLDVELQRVTPRAVEVPIVHENLNQFKADLNNDLKSLTGIESVNVKISHELGGFKTALNNDLKALTGIGPVKVPIKAGSLQDFKSDLNARLNTLTGVKAVKVGLEPDTTGFEAAVNTKLAALNATVKVRVEPDFTGFMAAIRAWEATHRPTIRVGIDADRSSLSGMLGSLNGLGGAAGGAAAGLGGFAAMLKVVAALAPTVIGAIGSIGLGLGGLATLAGPAIGGIAVGMSGVTEAFQAGSAAAESAGKDAEAAAKAQEAAARQIEQAERGVVRAERDLADSHKRAQDAQEDLTRARKEATEQIEDLNLQLRSSALDEESALIALERARERLAETSVDPEASALDQREALLGVREAEQRLIEVRERNHDLQEEAAEANRLGVEGSERVRDAKERLTDAEQGVLDAQQQVADAQQQLADAHRAAAEAATTSSAAADKYQQALANLSPEAAEFVTQMRTLGDQWKELRLATQDALFEGLAEKVTAAFTQLGPALETGLTGAASGVNGIITGILDTLMSDQSAFEQWMSGISGFFEALTPGIKAFTSGIVDMGAAAASAAGPLGAGLGSVFGQIGVALSKLENNGTLAKVMDGFAQALSGIGEFIGPLVEMMGDLGAIVGPQLGDMFSSLGSIITLLGPSFEQIATVVGGLLVEGFDVLAEVLPPIIDAFAVWIEAGAPLISLLGELAEQIIPPLTEAFSAYYEALTPVIMAFVDSLLPILPQLSELLTDLVPVVAEMAQTTGEAFVQALEDLAPHLPTLVQAFSDLMLELTPLLPALVELAASMLPQVTDALVEILPQATQFLELFTDIAQDVIPPVIEGIEFMAETLANMVSPLAATLAAWDGFFADIASIATKAWNSVVSVIAGAVRQIGELLNDIPFDVLGGGGLRSFGDSMVAWADRVESRQNRVGGDGSYYGSNRYVRYADGGGVGFAGPVRGPGGPKDDLVPALLSNGEHVLTAEEVQAAGGHDAIYAWRDRLVGRQVIRRADGGPIPRFATGSVVDGFQLTPEQWRMWNAFFPHNPTAKVTDAGYRTWDDGTNGTSFHYSGQALDIAGPNMMSYAQWIRAADPDARELFYDPLGGFVNGQSIGAIGGHGDHVHWTAGGDIGGAGVVTGGGDWDSAATGIVDPVTGTMRPRTADELAYDYGAGTSGRGPVEGDTDGDGYLNPVEQSQKTMPQRWSELAGQAAQEITADFLGVIGLNDTIPRPLRVADAVARNNAPGINPRTGRPYAQEQDTPVSPAPPTAPSPSGALEDTTPSPGGMPGIKGEVQRAFAPYGWDRGAQWDAVDWIVQKESSWNPTARNPSSGAFGLFQFNPSSGTLQQYLPDYNPAPFVQGQAGARYIDDRYDTPLGAQAFWQTHGWYADGGAVQRGATPVRVFDQGGWLKNGTLGVNLSGEHEPVLTHDQWADIKVGARLLENAGSGQRVAEVTRALTQISERPRTIQGRTGDNVTYVVADMDEAIRKHNRHREREARGYSRAGGR